MSYTTEAKELTFFFIKVFVVSQCFSIARKENWYKSHLFQMKFNLKIVSANKCTNPCSRSLWRTACSRILPVTGLLVKVIRKFLWVLLEVTSKKVEISYFSKRCWYVKTKGGFLCWIQTLPSSAFWSHSTIFFICSRKTFFPFVECPPLYHLIMASSLNTSAEYIKQSQCHRLGHEIIRTPYSQARS